MSKYKLIKEYPGSVSHGTIATKDTKNSLVYNVGIGTLDAKRIEDYPEYWEKLPEKTYEILEFKGRTYSFTLRHNGEYVNKEKEISWGGYTLDTMLRGNHSIVSVKRLSDGVVFTVGDKVKANWMSRDNAIIRSFHLGINNELGIVIDTTGFPLCEAVKVVENKPDFITEDGVGIMFNDTLSWVCKNEDDTTYRYLYELKFINSLKDLLSHSGDIYKVFSNKEAAEKFVEENSLVTVQLTKSELSKLKELLK